MSIGDVLFGDYASLRQVDDSAGNLAGRTQRNRQRDDEYAAASQQRAATISQATIDAIPQAEARQGQMGLAGDLQGVMRGDGPSVAQQQMMRGTDAALAATMSAGNSIRGFGGAGAARDLVASLGQVGQQSASDSAMLRAQEVAQARQQLGSVLGQVRDQDVGLAGQQANLGQQASIFNAEQEAQNRASVQQYKLALMQQGYGEAEADRAAKLELERMRINAGMNVAQLQQGAYDRQVQMLQMVAGGVAGALSGPMGAKAATTAVGAVAGK